VGKTCSVRALAERQNLELIEVNFERKPQFQAAFAGELSAASIISQLEILTRRDIRPGRCILFFDEIQGCPRAIQALRYFYEDLPALHVLAAGSLLEFVLGNTSFPVGRVNFAWMYPLTFREFLGALGHEKLASCLPAYPDSPGTLPASAQGELGPLLRDYFLVGGMPEAVARFTERHSLRDAAQVHEDLAASYLDDIRKYARGDAQLENTRHLLAVAFAHVGRQVNYTLIGQGDEIKRTRRSIDLLCQAMLLHKVRAVSPAGLPLGACAQEKPFKLVFLDIGLGLHLSGIDLAEVARAKDLNATLEGRLTEQFIGQELLGESLQGSENRELYYWARNAKTSTAEVDFVVARSGRVLPIEVKAGKSGRLKSLHRFLNDFGGRGLVLRDTHACSAVGEIDFWPLYTRV
jgi:hypothetical protein